MSDRLTKISKFLRLISAKFRGVLWHLIRILGAFQSPTVQEPCLGCHVSSQEQEENTAVSKLHTSYLKTPEADQIRNQFKQTDNGRKLLFWTNVPRALAQAWANANGANTLTDMMGSLMDEVHSHKQGKQWTKYVKGVSCLFAELAREKSSVLVLTTPPGVARYRKESTFMSLEEPILKENLNLQIHYVHPTVQGAEVVAYSRWPVDKTLLWSNGFGNEKQTDPADLWKEIRKGVKSPYFSLERFSPLHIESESKKRMQHCCLLSKTTTGCLSGIFRFIQQVIMFLKCRGVFPVQSFLRLLKQKLCRFVGQANHIARTIMSVQISFPCPGRRQIGDITQKDVGTQTQEKTDTEIDKSDKLVDIPQDCKPEKPSIIPVIKLTKRQKKLAKKLQAEQSQSRSEAGVSREPHLSQPTLQATMQTQSEALDSVSRKEHLRQLGVFVSALDRYVSQTGTHVEYKLQRTESPSMIIATLSCGGSKFQAQASTKKMAKRLAVQKACQHLNIA